jgi:hypothetical protein
MAYQSGDTILDDHYNIFVQGGAAAVNHTVDNVNTLWGEGTSDKGYGETGSTLSTVSAGSTITATQWANLLNRCTAIANHQGTSLTSITNPSTGDTISAYTALDGNITSIFNSRGNAAANGTDITANGTVTTTSTWSTSAINEQTVTFDSADAARYFFNAGGMVRLSWSLTGGSDAKSLEWADTLTKSGTIAITGGTATQTIAGTAYTGTTKVGGSGTPQTLATTTGWYDLTTSYVVVYKQTADSNPYTPNYIQVEIKATSDTVLSIKTSLIDDAADETAPDGSGTGDALDIVDGTLTQTMVVRPPSDTYLTSAAWGTPAMAASSWSVS